MLLKRLGRAVLYAAVGFYVLICVALYALQRQMLFPRPAPAALPERLAKVVKIDGPFPTVAWHLPAPAGAPTVVHFHGNGSQLANEEWMALECKQRGLGWFAVEFPGYGQAPGEPSQEAVIGASSAAIEWLEKSGVSKKDMVLLGQSLGTGAALYLASKGYGRALVLATPYTSIADIGARTFWWLPVRLLIRDPFPAAEWAAQATQPALVIHGTADQVIPFEIGEALSKKLPHAELLVLPGAGHNDIWDKQTTLDRALAFGATP
jgi:pimeloyl-ACP methyl ester carboxylesterase